MADRALILHVGRGKTGSTALQSSLAVNRDALAARGFAYPLPPATDNAGLRDIQANASWLFGDLPPPPAGWSAGRDLPERDARMLYHVQRWLAEIDGDGATILSSEFWWGMGQPLLESLADAIRARGFRPRVVGYIREQVDHFVSRYRQEIRKGRRGDTLREALRRHVDHVATGDPAADGSDYARMLALFEAAFGTGHVEFGVFERERMAGGDISRDFLARIGLDEAGLHFGKPANESGSVVEMETMRLMRRSPDLVTVDPRRFFRAARRTRLARDFDFLAYVDRVDIDRYRAVYARSNETVRARLFPDQAALFALRTPAEPREVDPAEMVRLALSYARRNPDALA